MIAAAPAADGTALALVWGGLIALILGLYVVLDGFDLGIGVLTLLTRSRERRGTMMSSIGAVWDANETWLVVAGGALFGAFPIVYAVVLNALYLPIMLMLFGLVFRAVSFEFRAQSRRKRPWEVCFGVGSLAAVLGQGFVLGGLLSEVKVGPEGFAGGPWDWLSLFSILVAVAVTLGYVMLGASYLVARTSGGMHAYVRHLLMGSAVGTFACVAGITAAMPFIYEQVRQRWFERPTEYVLCALVAGAAFAFVMLLLVTVLRRRTYLPFVFSLATFGVAYVGLIVAVYPYLVPASIRLEDAAADRTTLWFMLAGVGPLLPVMLLYNVYLYRTFRGHIEQEQTY